LENIEQLSVKLSVYEIKRMQDRIR